MTSDPELLKLIAFDKDDLEVIATHLQDGIVNVGEIIWHPAEQRVVIPICRFDWVASDGEQHECRRRLAALRFERVKAFKARNIDPANRAVVLNLLTAEYVETDAPSGEITLTFSGNVAIRLQVECLEGELADLGPAWKAAHRPGHPDNPEE